MCSARCCGTSVCTCLVTFLCVPFALVVGVVAISLAYINGIDVINKPLVNAIVAMTVVAIVTLLYGICASCCGRKVMKFILSVLFLALALFLLACGIYVCTFYNQFAKKLKKLFDDNVGDQEIKDTIQKILDKVGCSNLNDDLCAKLINHYANKFFMSIGMLVIAFGLLIGVGSAIGFWFSCSDEEKDRHTMDMSL